MRPLTILLAIAGLALAAIPAPADAQGLAPYQGFLLSTATPLGATDANWAFVAGDVNRDGAPDLVAINRQDTAADATSVHVLDGATNFQSYLLQSGTALGRTDGSWDFAMADYDGDGFQDLWGILRAKSGSGTTEVHVLSGATSFQTFIEQTGTALEETPQNWAFAVADVNRDARPDLVGYSQRGASNSTEVHVLDGAKRFGEFLVHTATPLPFTDARWGFGAGDANGDGVADAFAVDRQDPGSNRTTVNVLDGATGFKAYVAQTATVLGPTDANWSFVPAYFTRDPTSDVLAVARGAQTSVAVLDGALRPTPAPDPSPRRCGAADGLALSAGVARKTGAFGGRPGVFGRLTRSDGTPVAGTTVEISTAVGSAWAPVGTVVTGPDGVWGFNLPGGPTRSVYAAVSDGDTTPVCSTVVVQQVAAGVALKASRKRARNGQRVRFAGRLKGMSKAGRRVDVQGYQPRLRRWVTIATRTVRAGGGFKATYRFVATQRRTTYRFRALVRTQSGFPYVRGTSKTVKVRVRP